MSKQQRNRPKGNQKIRVVFSNNTSKNFYYFSTRRQDEKPGTFLRRFEDLYFNGKWKGKVDNASLYEDQVEVKRYDGNRNTWYQPQAN